MDLRVSLEAHLITFVREQMSDEQILDLIRAELVPTVKAWSTGGAYRPDATEHNTAARAARKANASKPNGAAAEPKKARKPRKAAPTFRKLDTNATIEAVAAHVKAATSGVSSGDVAHALNLNPVHIRAALKALNEGKTIAQFGDRRFSRYGSTPAKAKEASLAARGVTSEAVGRVLNQAVKKAKGKAKKTAKELKAVKPKVRKPGPLARHHAAAKKAAKKAARKASAKGGLRKRVERVHV